MHSQTPGSGGAGPAARAWSRDGVGLQPSSCVMSSLISARTSELAARPRSVPNSESSSCACARAARRGALSLGPGPGAAVQAAARHSAAPSVHRRGRHPRRPQRAPPPPAAAPALGHAFCLQATEAPARRGARTAAAARAGSRERWTRWRNTRGGTCACAARSAGDTAAGGPAVTKRTRSRSPQSAPWALGRAARHSAG